MVKRALKSSLAFAETQQNFGMVNKVFMVKEVLTRHAFFNGAKLIR
jgi:hypothetical protein